ncbi:MAG: hypothetical protein II695_00605, partial [Oscillospiraceae bacterium]|nr:hypothetical protein [Oscillospiraceae bacterium]
MMKRISVILGIILAMMCGASVSAEIYLDDRLGLYGDSTEEVRQMMQDASDKTGWNIGIVTCDYGYNMDIYSDDEIYDMAGAEAEKLVGSVFGEDTNSVLFLCEYSCRYVCINNEPRRYIQGKRFDDMDNQIRDRYYDYDDFGTAKAFLDNVVYCYNLGPTTEEEMKDYGHVDENGYYTQFPEDNSAIYIAIGIGLVISLIVVGCIVYTYRKPQPLTANEYLDRNSFDMYQRKTILVSTRNYS